MSLMRCGGALCRGRRYKYRLVVDESISLGVLGRSGRGAAEAAGLQPSDVDIITASLGAHPAPAPPHPTAPSHRRPRFPAGGNAPDARHVSVHAARSTGVCVRGATWSHRDSPSEQALTGARSASLA